LLHSDAEFSLATRYFCSSRTSLRRETPARTNPLKRRVFWATARSRRSMRCSAGLHGPPPCLCVQKNSLVLSTSISAPPSRTVTPPIHAHSPKGPSVHVNGKKRQPHQLPPRLGRRQISST
jgi:hypothetical protein